MKLIDTFLFSEPYESDLLWLKFKLETPFVDEWIIQECDHTTQGDFKGLFANGILEEERFKPYLNRIKIFQHHGNPAIKDGKENTNFMRENFQRTLCAEYLSTQHDDTLVIVSDTDEMIDCTDEDKRLWRFKEILKRHHNEYFFLGRMRYWFDYDNRCYLPNIRIPIANVGMMKRSGGLKQCLSTLRHIQGQGPTYDVGETPIAFEYSYVFKSLEDLWRKKTTYAHNNFDVECLEKALKYNHWPRTSKRGERVGQEPYDFFEKVTLTEENSPKYVRENIEKLRTNIVSSVYRLNRTNDRIGPNE